MKTKITVVALLAVTAGVFAYTRPHNAVPSDLRDAVADKAIDTLKGKAATSQGNVPEPKVDKVVLDNKTVSVESLDKSSSVLKSVFSNSLSSDITLSIPGGVIEGALGGHGAKLTPNGRGGFKGGWNGYAAELTPNGKGGFKGGWNGYAAELSPDGRGGVKGYWNGRAAELTPDGRGGFTGDWNGYKAELVPNGKGGIIGGWNGYAAELTPNGKGGFKGYWNGRPAELTPNQKGGIEGYWNGYSLNFSLTNTKAEEWLSNQMFLLILFSCK